MVVLSWIDSLFEWGKLIGLQWIQKFKAIVQQIVTLLSFFIVVLWLATFLYACFTFTYMPPVAHEREVHLNFRSDCSDYQNGILCEFPSANFSLLKDSQAELLTRGQTYVVSLDMEMPESPENLQHGMFMVVMQFYSRYGEVVRSSARAVLMRYKSFLHRILETLVFIPTLLIGSTEQKQTLYVQLFETYQEDPYRPALGAYIEVQSKRIQLYRTTMKIHASFTGLRLTVEEIRDILKLIRNELVNNPQNAGQHFEIVWGLIHKHTCRYFLYHWPVTSAIIGISTNTLFITLILLVAYVNLRGGAGNGVSDGDEKKRALREDLIREKAKKNGSRETFELMSSSSKASPKTSRSSLNVSVDSEGSTDPSAGAKAEDVSFTGEESEAAGAPQVRVPQPSSTGTDAGDLRYRHVHQS